MLILSARAARAPVLRQVVAGTWLARRSRSGLPSPRIEPMPRPPFINIVGDGDLR